MALTAQYMKVQHCPLVLQEDTEKLITTHRQEDKLCCLFAVLLRGGGINHNQGKPSAVHPPRARAAATLARSSSTGNSEDGGICSGTGEEGQGAVPCLATPRACVCVSL